MSIVIDHHSRIERQKKKIESFDQKIGILMSQRADAEEELGQMIRERNAAESA